MSDKQAAEAAAFAAVVALAQRENLGEYRMSYRAAKIKTIQLVGQLIFGILFLILVVGIFFLVLAFMTPNLNSKRAAKRLHFFERGLILAEASGPVAFYTWDSISVLQAITQRYVNGVYVGTTYIYTLLTRDGKKVKVTNFYEKPTEWGPAIQASITRAQLPGVVASLESGASVTFGPLVINRGGIATGSKSLRWDEIKEIDVNQGYLRIKKTSGWSRWSTKPVSQIPNFFVFFAAANHLREQTHQLPS
jgi:hypothetical protein